MLIKNALLLARFILSADLVGGEENRFTGLRPMPCITLLPCSGLLAGSKGN